MPPFHNASHDRPQPSSAFRNSIADPPSSSVGSTTSYTTLAHALAPEPSAPSTKTYYRQSSSSASRGSPHMASDSRYMYHPQEVAPPPPYPYPYPAAPYENGQYTQGSSRPPVRSPPPPQPVQHPPQPAPYNGAHPPYQQGYPPGYGVPPQHPHQWSGEWSHYNAPYPPPPPPGQQPPYPPPAGPRPDLSPSTSNDDRRYPQQPQRPEPRRTEERPPQRPEAAPPPVRKTRENEHPAPAPAPPAPVPVQAQAPAPPPPPPPAPPAAPSLPPPGVGLDFTKLVESYRLILDTAGALQYDPNVVRPPAPPETLERMLQAATYGAQVLDAAVKRTAPEPPRAPAERAPDESEGEASRSRQSENGPATEGQTCLGCSATSTPEWRRGPMGPRTLCNACGLVYAKLIKKRNRDGPGRQRGGGQNAKSSGQPAHPPPSEDPGAASSGEGSGDDDDSYGSQQDRRSDMGYRGSRE